MMGPRQVAQRSLFYEFSLEDHVPPDLGGGPMDGLCSASEGFPLTGMVPMYLLMSAFHSHHWLKLISTRRA